MITLQGVALCNLVAKNNKLLDGECVADQVDPLAYELNVGLSVWAVRSDAVYGYIVRVELVAGSLPSHWEVCESAPPFLLFVYLDYLIWGYIPFDVAIVFFSYALQ